jgi:hypothetical protein
MQVSLTESNIKRIVQLLKDSETRQDKSLAEYLEQFLKTQTSFGEVSLDEIPF